MKTLKEILNVKVNEKKTFFDNFMSLREKKTIFPEAIHQQKGSKIIYSAMKL